MDAARFDALARALAVRAPRRAALGILAGALAPGRAGSATRRCLKAGQPCPAPKPAIGKRKVCCRGAACDRAVGRCACKPGYVDRDGDGICARAACLDAGDVCASAEDCCQETVLGGLACAVVDANKGGPRGCGTLQGPNTPTVCCRRDGSVCGGDCDCCGTMICRDGRCRENCREVGEGCVSADRCCGPPSRAACGVIDRDKVNGVACPAGEGGGNRCCVLDGQPCDLDCQCCGPSLCRIGVCADPGGQVPRCVEDGRSCIADADCCRSPESACHPVLRECRKVCQLVGQACSNDGAGPFCCANAQCVSGRCEFLPSNGCGEAGDVCNAQFPCCNDLQCISGRCVDRGCVEIGGACAFSIDCCDGVSCLGGRCRFCIPPGEPCASSECCGSCIRGVCV